MICCRSTILNSYSTDKKLKCPAGCVDKEKTAKTVTIMFFDVPDQNFQTFGLNFAKDFESKSKSWFTSWQMVIFYNGYNRSFSRIRVVEKLLILVQSFCLVMLWLRVDRPSPFFEPFKISFFCERFLVDSEFSRSNWIKNSRSESLFKSL